VFAKLLMNKDEDVHA